VFKKPKKNRVYGRISNIERDLDKVTWTRGGPEGSLPAYITVELEKRNAAGQTMYAKTYETKLRFIGA
jgi:hypothetical protein